MATWGTTTQTALGEDLIAKILAGVATNPLTFTNVKLSSYAYPAGTDYRELTDLQNVEISVPHGQVELGDDNSVSVTTLITNETVTTGFYIQNVGLYANDPDVGEILFLVVPAVTADFFPAVTSNVASIILTLVAKISHDVPINFTLDPAGVPSMAEINNLQGQIDVLKASAGISVMIYEEAATSTAILREVTLPGATWDDLVGRSFFIKAHLIGQAGTVTELQITSLNNNTVIDTVPFHFPTYATGGGFSTTPQTDWASQDGVYIAYFDADVSVKVLNPAYSAATNANGSYGLVRASDDYSPTTAAEGTVLSQAGAKALGAEVSTHIDTSVASATGVHNFRYFDNLLQWSDGTNWNIIQTGGGDTGGFAVVHGVTLTLDKTEWVSNTYTFHDASAAGFPTIETIMDIKIVPETFTTARQFAKWGIFFEQDLDNDSIIFKAENLPDEDVTLRIQWWQISAEDPTGGAKLSDDTPIMDGMGYPGVSDEASRSDHVHPTDTSRAPISHAVATETYGRGNANLFGHVKLSDSVTDTSNVGNGFAATPRAVNIVNDRVTALDGSVVKTVNNLAPDTNGNINFNTNINPISTFITVNSATTVLETEANRAYVLTNLVSLNLKAHDSYVPGFSFYVVSTNTEAQVSLRAAETGTLILPDSQVITFGDTSLSATWQDCKNKPIRFIYLGIINGLSHPAWYCDTYPRNENTKGQQVYTHSGTDPFYLTIGGTQLRQFWSGVLINWAAASASSATLILNTSNIDIGSSFKTFSAYGTHPTIQFPTSSTIYYPDGTNLNNGAATAPILEFKDELLIDVLYLGANRFTCSIKPISVT